MAASSYDAALAALGSRGPGRMVPDLDRITGLLDLLGDPQLAYPTVHVTGTNGKGSMVRMVGALCSAAGMSAGTYTSPHLQTVRERLSLAGRPIAPTRFAELHDEVATYARMVDRDARLRHDDPAARLRHDDRAARLRHDADSADPVTYFELLTAMALAWFADLPVDVGVIEVGMGGRWDATNLVRGDVAVLGEVDVDHPQLGSTPAEVAGEKLGIVKPGSVVVSARQTGEVQDLLEAAVADRGATLWQLWDGDGPGSQAVDQGLEVVDRRVAVGGQLITLRVGERVIDDILLPVHGEHQARNAAVALGAFAALTGAAFESMEDDVVRHGLAAVQIPGRLEVVHREPTVLLDGAHNPHGVRAVAVALSEAFEFRDLVLVAGCLDDKDLPGILSGFVGAVSHVVVTTSPSPRAAPLDAIAAAAEEVWRGTGIAVEAIPDLEEALIAAEALTGEGDGVLIAGSLTTVGAARDRYLPVDDAADDAADTVVLTPEDEAALADDEIAEEDVAEATDVLEDETRFQLALEALLEDAVPPEDPYQDAERPPSANEIEDAIGDVEDDERDDDGPTPPT